MELRPHGPPHPTTIRSPFVLSAGHYRVVGLLVRRRQLLFGTVLLTFRIASHPESNSKEGFMVIKVRERSVRTKSATPQRGVSLLSLLCSLSTLLVEPHMVQAEEQSVPCIAPPSLFSFVNWFDPFFFGYNVLLFLFAILAVPGITYFYVKNMKTVKYQRVKMSSPNYSGPRMHR